MTTALLLALSAATAPCIEPPATQVAPAAFPPAGEKTPQPPQYAPLAYDCRFTATAPVLDGKLDDAAWSAAPWTADFLDIQGPALPKPRYRTRAKMLWDDAYFYIAAELEEPHLWATLAKHDEIVFHDNDFEVFIDPDGDTREYYELEVNALETIFDLYLHRRYKEDGPAEHGWDAKGLKTAVHLEGTLNDPTDRDRRWTLEWAIPWSAFTPPELGLPGFTEAARKAAAPKPGECWRVNFSRVQWTHQFEGTVAPPAAERPIDDSFRLEPRKDDAPAKPRYEKVKGRPEDNWTWTPQWQIDMHDPRWWGKVVFVRDAAAPAPAPAGDAPGKVPPAPSPASPPASAPSEQVVD